MYDNGMGFRAIERVKNVHHTTIINWVKSAGNSYQILTNQKQIPKWENQMNYKNLWAKTNKASLWKAVDHFKPGILELVLGDHSAKIFEPLWAEVSK